MGGYYNSKGHYCWKTLYLNERIMTSIEKAHNKFSCIAFFCAKFIITFVKILPCF